jgi:hypothetical protein
MFDGDRLRDHAAHRGAVVDARTNASAMTPQVEIEDIEWAADTAKQPP